MYSAKGIRLDFATYCHRNPKACPLIAIGVPGDPFLPMLGEDLDIRTDVPRYTVMRDGKVIDEPTDIKHLWRDDLVAFVWGCSFSFENALMESGVSLRDIARGDNVVMYQTNIDSFPVGPFKGKVIVTMRPLVPAQAIRAIQVTSRFPNVHGAPIHIGAPELIGISDLEKPLFNGTPPQMRPRRASGVLGLRRHAAACGRACAPVAMHHAQTGLDGHFRSAQHELVYTLIQCFEMDDEEWMRFP